MYKVNLHNPDKDKITQYARAVNELGIELIHARSPQAKGRVERSFKTHQDRLVKELRLASISTIDEANRFIQNTYLPQHNTQFAVKAKDPSDAHRPLVGYDLASILTTKEERNINADLTFQYRVRWFQLSPKQPTILFAKNHIIISEHYDGTITATLRTATLNFKEIAKRPERPSKEGREPGQKVKIKPWIPSMNHPWRQYQLK